MTELRPFCLVLTKINFFFSDSVNYQVSQATTDVSFYPTNQRGSVDEDIKVRKIIEIILKTT